MRRPSVHFEKCYSTSVESLGLKELGASLTTLQVNRPSLKDELSGQGERHVIPVGKHTEASNRPPTCADRL